MLPEEVETIFVSVPEVYFRCKEGKTRTSIAVSEFDHILSEDLSKTNT